MRLLIYFYLLITTSLAQLYQKGDKVELIVNTATSPKNHPLSYYHLPFVCPASSNVSPIHMSLPQILTGNTLYQSDYSLNFKIDQPCLRLCDRIMNQRNIKRSISLINDNYIANWFIDDLPGATTFIKDSVIDDIVKKYYVKGFPLGFINKNGETFINNHLMMVIRYHHEFDNNYSIVGFEIYPKSVNDASCPGASKNYQNLKLDPNDSNKLIPYTYSIYWREDNQINYQNRWKLYIDSSQIDENGKILNKNPSSTIHWVSLINSFVIFFFLSIVLAFIIIITFRSSSSSSSQNTPTSLHDLASASFNKPFISPLLSILTGAGIQLFFSLFLFTLIAIFPFKNILSISSNDLKILYPIIFLIIISGFFAGFTSIQLYKLFNNSPNVSFKLTCLMSSLSSSLPISIPLIIILIVNHTIFKKNSPNSLEFSTFIYTFSIYCIVQIPIAIIGGLVSSKLNIFYNILSKRKSKEISSSSSSSSSYLPNKKPIYLYFPFSFIIIGIFPSSIIFIESKFIYSTLLSLNNSNIIAGFIIISSILLSLIMFEIGIIATYLKLKNNLIKNWQWWIFLNSSFSIWCFLNYTSLYNLFFVNKIIKSDSTVLYITYTTIINTLISITCGSISLVGATFFIYLIVCNSSNKHD